MTGQAPDWERRHAETLHALESLPHRAAPRAQLSWADDATLVSRIRDRAELLMRLRGINAPPVMISSQKVLLLEAVLWLLEDPQ